MSFSIKDSVVSFIGKDIINTILKIWICMNQFPNLLCHPNNPTERVFGSDDRG
jgi:hypothetical protein